MSFYMTYLLTFSVFSQSKISKRVSYGS